ncbi:tolB protein-related [Striga hermonthica]|uniref:TolB protein-related n=1 Tax=Striga hermonthica TaxID=68872 RepID=A0A9N7N2E1_STRHE|nr:tolB protein-related [Striga hermonthica]
MDPPTGTIIFTSVGRPYYGFDVFSVTLPSNFDDPFPERRLTDGRSVNFNGQFVDEDGTLVFISERTGSARIFLNRPGESSPEQLHTPPESLFHDRPVVKNCRLYFISAHERPDKPFRSWSALYSTGLERKNEKAAVRLTPYGSVDYSPAVSRSGNLVAVASYGSRPWDGEFHHLETNIVVFQESDPSNRVVVCERGGWPTWSGDSSLYFHLLANDGWWSIYRADLPNNFASTSASLALALAPIRVTPPGIHCFTPAAMHHSGNKLAVATRRKGSKYRHIEIFDVDRQKFHPVTERINPDIHHYSPFISPESNYLGYHRFRGESGPGESTVPHLDPITSPTPKLDMFRLNGNFPAFSPSGDLVAFNHNLGGPNAGLKVVKSDGSMRWTLIENRSAFCNSWSPVNDNVIFTSIGPIFESEDTAVQIARVTFDPKHLSGNCNRVPVEIKILTKKGTGNNAFPSCSPDGKSIVFRSGRSGHKNLYIVGAVKGEIEGEIRQLTEGPWIDTMPSWSPDGKLIAFSSNRHNRDNTDAFGIYLVKPDGTGVTRVQVAGVEEERERLNHVCFSVDGEWLLFTANLGGVTAEPVGLPNQFQPYGDLYLVRLDGSCLRRLTWNGYENGTPAWHSRALVSGDEVSGSFTRLCLRDENGEDKLTGQFDDPLWIRCDL